MIEFGLVWDRLCVATTKLWEDPNVHNFGDRHNVRGQCAVTSYNAPKNEDGGGWA